MSSASDIRYFTKMKDQKEGFNFKFEDEYFEDLIKDSRIDYTHLIFDELINERKWDNIHPMAKGLEDKEPWGDERDN